MLKVKADTNMTQKTKDRQYDGRSRPTNELYSKRWNEIFKKEWIDAGCALPYMGFNLLPLSVIPNFRITNKGLVDVNSMKIEPLFE